MAILRNTLVLVLSLILTTSAFANGFLAGIGPDHEYRVALLTSGQAMTQTEQQALAEIKAKLNPVFSSTIKTFGINFFTAVNKTEFFKILGENLDKEVGPILAKYNDKLPSSTKNFFNFYIMPWDAKAPVKELDQLPEDLKILNQFFKVVEHTSKENGVYIKNFREGIENQDRNNYGKQDPFYLNAISAQFKLQKDRSGFQMQILGTLNPATGSLSIDNDEVNLTEFVIKDGKIADINDKARVLVEFSKKFDKSEEQFEAIIKFGKLAKNLSVFPDFPYAFELEQYLGLDESDACRDRRNFVPNLRGGFKLIGDSVLLNMDFYIFDVVINPNVLKVESMNVKLGVPAILRNPFTGKVYSRIGTLGLMDCHSVERANKQFAEESDAMLQEQLDKIVAPDDMTDSLLDEVLGEGNGQFTDVF